ncbi:unnamed protein product [Paramecium primaurelia]|uniref:Uncharacterized protein n=1 Tax=Paramecium primaurelia TaxID=5886 RepID=A0A8S1MK99_PARPR|nr:unnamed protein product [Paramecium primaurelia]
MLINFIKIQLILKQIRTFQQQSSLHDKDFSFFLIPFLNPLMKKQTKLMLKYLLKKSMLIILFLRKQIQHRFKQEIPTICFNGIHKSLQ